MIDTVYILKVKLLCFSSSLLIHDPDRSFLPAGGQRPLQTGSYQLSGRTFLNWFNSAPLTLFLGQTVEEFLC
jgi:hypothetical protein